MISSKNNKPAQALKNVMDHKKYMAYGCSIILNTSFTFPEFTLQDPLDVYSESYESLILDLTTYASRLRTFNGVWELDFITPNQMAKAGFSYSGEQDCVRCGSCSKVFYDWEHGDDPFVIHKSKSPQCQFVNENNGNYQYKLNK